MSALMLVLQVPLPLEHGGAQRVPVPRGAGPPGQQAGRFFSQHRGHAF